MNRFARLAAVAAALGGLAWIPIRVAISITFSEPLFGLSYVEWNRLMLVPLPLLLIAGVQLARRTARGLGGRIGSGLAILGLVGMTAGVYAEFYVAGGLVGDRGGAILGWGIYLVSLLAHVVGLATFGVASRTATPGLAGAALVIAALHVLWPFSGVVDALLVADQVLIGVAWVAVGWLLWPSGRRPR